MKLRSHAKRIGAGLTALAGVACAVLASTPAPALATTPADVSVRVGAITMRPAPDGGYVGSAILRISYTGPAGAYANLMVAAPEGLYLSASADDSLMGCIFRDRWTSACGLTGYLVSGQTREVRLQFTALAASFRRTRPTLTGSVSATAGKLGEELVETTPADNTAGLAGSMLGIEPGRDGPYRPATTYDLRTTAASSEITFVPDAENGAGYVGTATLTVRAGTDAYQQFLHVTLVDDLPGHEYLSISPPQVCLYASCTVPGGRLPQLRSRTVTVSVHAEEAPAAGTTMRFRADTNVGGEYAEDVSPADNTVTLTVA